MVTLFRATKSYNAGIILNRIRGHKALYIVTKDNLFCEYETSIKNIKKYRNMVYTSGSQFIRREYAIKLS